MRCNGGHRHFQLSNKPSQHSATMSSRASSVSLCVSTMYKCITMIDHDNSHNSAWIDIKERYNIDDGDPDSEQSIIMFDKGGETFRYKFAMSRSKSLIDYCIFLDHFAYGLLGVHTWQSKRGVEKIHDAITVGDEAFLLAVVDGNYSRWMYEAYNPDGNQVCTLMNVVCVCTIKLTQLDCLYMVNRNR